MTNQERASLASLEDMLVRRLDRLEEKIDTIDTRVRKVEVDQAAYHGAKEEAASGGARRVQQAGLALSFAVLFVAVPGSVFAFIEIVKAVSGA